MPESRGRKKGQVRSKNNPLEIHAQPLPQPPKNRWEKIRDHPIPWTIALAAALLAIGSPIYDALREPQIHPSSAQLADAFSLPFSLYNPSFIFKMHDMTLGCVIYDVTMDKGGGGKGFTVVQVGAPITIGQRKTRQYICPFDKILAIFKGQKLKADVAINAKFKTLWFRREAMSDHFTWSASTGQWVEGTPIN